MSWGSEHEARELREEPIMETRKMKPILFSGPMVQKLLAGEKTVTRRVIKQKAVEDVLSSPARKSNSDISDLKFIKALCNAPYEPGDILWVRETFFECKGSYYYKSDGKHEALDALIGGSFFKWRPSIFMPREAARIFLRVAGVRVEQLNDIRDGDVIAEGIDATAHPTMGKRRLAFADLWNSINAKREGGAYAWENNPWVWVIEFERVEQP